MMYNVKDFGAKGNGRSNDTKAIQNAIDTAYKNGGGTVYIPEGTYMIKGNHDAADGGIRLPSNITLEGAGMGLTNLKLVDDYNYKLTGIVRTISGEVTKNVVIRDITIDGNQANNKGEVDGIFTGVTPFRNGADQNILIERVEIKEVSRYGFDPHEQTIGLTIRDSVAHHNGKDGFVADYLIDSVFENNISYANGRHGFNIVTSTSDMILRNNIAYDNGSSGLVIQRGSDHRPLTDNILVDGGKYYNNGGEGIAVRISTDIEIRNTEIFDNGTYGIALAGNENVLVHHNKIYDNSINSTGTYSDIIIMDYDDTNGASGKLYSAKYNNITDNILSIGEHVNVKYAVEERAGKLHGNEVTNNLIGDTTRDALQLNKAQESDNTIVDDIKGLNGLPAIIQHITDEQDAYGTNKGDLLFGNHKNNTIHGLGGNDLIMGGAGDDSLKGYAGNDTIVGGKGEDTIIAGEGNDKAYGGAGNDLITTHEGNDTASGGAGDDRINAGDGDDVIMAGSGTDRVWGGLGADRFVFSKNEDVTYVRDFELGTDTLDLQLLNLKGWNDFLGKATLENTAAGDMWIHIQGTSIHLEDVTTKTLQADDFIF